MPGVDGLWTLGTRAVVANPTELLGSQRMRAVVAELAQRFDMVLIDSPPVLPVADAMILSGYADGGAAGRGGRPDQAGRAAAHRGEAGPGGRAGGGLRAEQGKRAARSTATTAATSRTCCPVKTPTRTAGLERAWQAERGPATIRAAGTAEH